MQKAGTSKQQADSQWLIAFSSLLKYSLTHSATPSPSFEGGVKKRRSGSPLSPSAVLGASSLSKGKPRGASPEPSRRVDFLPTARVYYAYGR